MGNCLPKLKKKNKVSPHPKVLLQINQKATISEILSRSSASMSISSGSSNEEVYMLNDMTVSDGGRKSIETLVYQREETTMDELKDKESAPEVKKPVFFQVDFVQGMPHKTPARLAERMESRMEVQKSTVQLILTEEDEMFMSEILEETEATEKRAKLEAQHKMADVMRDEHLESIREKARYMRAASRPPTRAGFGGGGGRG